jgi:hypothetical protein
LGLATIPAAHGVSAVDWWIREKLAEFGGWLARAGRASQ